MIPCKARDLLSDAIAETRNISHDLMPSGIKEFGFRQSLKSILNTLSISRSIQVNFDYQISSHLPDPVMLGIYRMVQETTNNVIKHSEAAHVSVRLHEDKQDFLLLTVSDDGKGFEPNRNNNEAVDIILMDIRMRKMNGVETTKKVLEEFPQSRIIALTMFNEDKYIEEMLKAGAYGYILKESGKPEVINAIRTVEQNESYFSDEVTKTIMARYSPSVKQLKNKKDAQSYTLPVEELTERERQVLLLIAEEYTNMEISEKLHISNRTVDTHRRNLLQKIGVKNTAGLVRYAIKSGLMD